MSKTNNDNETTTWKDPHTSDELMGLALDHYLKHHQIVLKKLLHAREATLQSINEIEELCEQLQNTEKGKELKEVKAYDEMWNQIIALFRRCGIAEEEIEKVEDILLSIPKAIRKYYEELVRQDTELLKLMEELNSEKYKQALNQIREVQAQPNPVSGLGPEEYDLINISVDQEKDVHFFKELPTRRSLH